MTKLIFYHENTSYNPNEKTLTVKSPITFILHFYDSRMNFLFTEKLPDTLGETSKTMSFNLTYPTKVNVEVISPCSLVNFGLFEIQLTGGDVYKILLEYSSFPMAWQGYGQGMKEGKQVGFYWTDYPPKDDYDVWTRGDWF
jgi:hypothetical protein